MEGDNQTSEAVGSEKEMYFQFDGSLPDIVCRCGLIISIEDDYYCDECGTQIKFVLSVPGNPKYKEFG